ncbi:MAG: caspase family protein [Crocinitomicaceae bacterium]|nr:caspase family protein [Crocinitomicaceae bacterium]
MTDLFILAVGINSYKNPQYNLEYAVNDAQSFVHALSAQADSLFNSVKIFEIYNEMALKGNIVAAINEVKSLVGPEDVFIFYYAGHGVMSYAKVAEDSDFFIVTHDVTNLYSETVVLQEKAISANELMDYSVEISAAKQLFILDACHSGGALDAFATRGDGREKALAQLARSTGTFFITAAQDAQYANEVGDLKHGLFTYALLEILNGEQGNNGDDKITISELKVYVEERVPELSEQYRGSPQYPTSYGFGQDFPIVILK